MTIEEIIDEIEKLIIADRNYDALIFFKVLKRRYIDESKNKTASDSIELPITPDPQDESIIEIDENGNCSSPIDIKRDPMDKLEIALREYQKYNRIRNDLDAYLFYLGEWALGESDEKPKPEDYDVAVTE